MRSVAIALLVQGTKNEKEIILKKEQYEDGKSSSDFGYSSEGVEA